MHTGEKNNQTKYLLLTYIYISEFWKNKPLHKTPKQNQTAKHSSTMVEALWRPGGQPYSCLLELH